MIPRAKLTPRLVAFILAGVVLGSCSGDPKEASIYDCEDFCAGILGTCPGDTACAMSCEHAPIAPTQDAVQCAEDATSCDDNGACWDLLGL